MTPTLHRLLWWGRQALLTVGAVVGTVCILVGISAALFGLRPLVFESGSMSPTIDTGALAISRNVDASDLKVGDIVSVPTGSGERVTHRIVTITVRGDLATMALKGDANQAPDARTYQVSHADRVLFDVPRLGYVVSWLVGPMGLFLLGLYAAFLLSVILRRDPTDGSPPEPDQRTRSPRDRSRDGSRRAEKAPTLDRAVSRGVALVVAAVAATCTVLPVPVTPTLAAWGDTVGVSGTVLTAYTVPQPVLTCAAGTPSSTGNTQHMTYTWPGSTDPDTTYTVSVTGLGVPGTNTLTGTTTKSLDIAYDSSQATNKNAVATVTISPALTTSASWTGPQALTKFKANGAAKNPGVCGEADPPANMVLGAPDATTRTIANEKTFITATCTTNTVILCGSYSDASAVTVGYTLKRTVSGTVKCWTGSWSNPQTGGVCTTVQAGSTSVVNGVQTFFETATQNNVYLASGGAGTYVLTVTLTDLFNNVTTQSVTFTLT